jgi:type IX secretion system PorP/SprF family membrane protein
MGHKSTLFKLPFIGLMLVLGISFLGLNSSQAQDARFAQFYHTPLQLNPALTGVFEGQFRGIANYRDLYSSVLGAHPYRTISASFDMRTNVGRNDHAGFGVSALRDEAGISGFNRTNFSLSGSYQKQMGGNRFNRNNQFLVAGAQLGLGQRGFEWQQLWFTQQYDLSSYSVNQGLDNGEGFSSTSTDLYVDFNAGILYYAIFGANQSVYVGGAIHHVNEPNISFLENNDERLPTKYVLHAGGEFPIADNISLLPAVAFMSQGPSMSTTAGMNLRYSRREWQEVAIRAGLWGHIANKLDKEVHFDAMTISAILEVERMSFGLSYDITTSVLSEANNSRGAFEISFIYIHRPRNRRARVDCPRF